MKGSFPVFQFLYANLGAAWAMMTPALLHLTLVLIDIIICTIEWKRNKGEDAQSPPTSDRSAPVLKVVPENETQPDLALTAIQEEN